MLKKLFSVLTAILMICFMIAPVSARDNPPYRIRIGYHIYSGAGVAEFTCTQNEAIQKIQQAAAQRKNKIICHISGSYNMKTVTKQLMNPYVSGYEYAIRTINDVAWSYTDNTLTVNYRYILTPAEERTINARVDSAVRSLHLTGSNYQKAVRINDYICQRTWYVDAYRSTPYNLLVQRGCTCEGYSLTFLLMCQRAGIPAHIVLGTDGGTGHAWDVFASRGRWYTIDTTFNDNYHNHKYIVPGKYMARHVPWTNARAMLASLPAHPVTHDYAPVQRKNTSAQKKTVPAQKRVTASQRKAVPAKRTTTVPQRKTVTSQRKAVTPQKKTVPAQKKITAPQKKVVPQKRTTTPKKSTISKQRPASPEKKAVVPQQKPVSPEKKPVAPKQTVPSSKPAPVPKEKAEKKAEKEKEKRESKEEKLAEVRDNVCFVILVFLLVDAFTLLICCANLAYLQKKKKKEKVF